MFLSNQESWDYIHCLYKMLFFFFLKKRAEDPVCVMLQTETVEKYIAWFGSQSSGFVFPPELQGSFSLKQAESCINSSRLHLFSGSLQKTRSAISDHNCSFSFVHVLWSDSARHGCTRKIQVLVYAVSIIITE